MRFEGIETIEQGNKFLNDRYMDLWNNRFAVHPASDYNAHRSAAGYDLKAIFSVQIQRTVRNDYTISLDNKVYQIEGSDLTGLRRNKVIVEKRLNGNLRLRFKGRYHVFHMIEDKKGR
jgi:hypothetical protein